MTCVSAEEKNLTIRRELIGRESKREIQAMCSGSSEIKIRSCLYSTPTRRV